MILWASSFPLSDLARTLKQIRCCVALNSSWTKCGCLPESVNSIKYYGRLFHVNELSLGLLFFCVRTDEMRSLIWVFARAIWSYDHISQEEGVGYLSWKSVFQLITRFQLLKTKKSHVCRQSRTTYIAMFVLQLPLETFRQWFDSPFCLC